MLSIRADQWNEFRSEFRRAFLEQLAAHLRARFSKRLANANDEELRVVVVATAARAEAHGMSSKDQIRRFAEVVIAARDGLEEDAEPEKLQRILGDRGSGPRQKLTALEDWLLFEEGR